MIFKCLICEKEFPEEDLISYNNKDVCTDCITELL